MDLGGLMDTKTRAEKIWDDLENRRMGVRIKGIWVARLTQELDEAVREALKEDELLRVINLAERDIQNFEDGFAVAQEKAAGICEERISRGATDSFRLEPNFRAIMKQQPEIALREINDACFRAIAERIRAMEPGK